MTVVTPLPSRRARRILVTAAAVSLGLQILIVVTGGVVRLTASGLGCPEWPECVAGSVTPTADQVEGAARFIEFGNRLLTFAVGLGAVAVLAAVLLLRRRLGLRGVALLAAMPLVGTAGQAVLGGITVLTGLHPATVAGHFLLSMVLIAVSTWLLVRVAEPAGPVVDRLPAPLRATAWALAGVGAVVLVLGTVVTGSGPHSGDADQPARFGLDPRTVSWLHADAVMILIGLLVGYLVALRVARVGGGARRAAHALVGLVVVQAVVGYTQYALALPRPLVAIHMLLACGFAALLTANVLATRRRAGASVVTLDPAAGVTAPQPIGARG